MDEARLDDQAEDRAPRATLGTRRRALKGLRADANKDAAFVFPSRPSKTGYRVEIEPDWKELSAAAQLTGVRLHDLRHTYASILASAGQSLPIIGALLGHTQASTTQRYSHLADDPLRKATEIAAAVITGKPSAEIVQLGKRA
jgi:integrase